MKNLNRLGFLATIGTMAAFSFSIGACSDDPEPTGGTGGTGGTGVPGTAGKGGTTGTSGSTATGGTGGSTGGGGAATGGGGAATGGGGAATGGGGMATGGGGAATGGGGAATGGGGAGGSGGAGGKGGAGGSGGSGGGAPSAACAKLCQGADSVPVICAQAMVTDATLKMESVCLTRCAKETNAANTTCWQTHATNYKTMQGDHCKHATGDGTVCKAWPAP